MLSPQKLKYLRLLHDLTQSEVGKEMGVTKNYISELENGKAQYSEDQQNKFVNAIYKVHEGKKSVNVEEILNDVTKEVRKMGKSK